MLFDAKNFDKQDWTLSYTLTWILVSGKDPTSKKESYDKILAEMQRRFVPNNIAFLFTEEQEHSALEAKAPCWLHCPDR